MVADHGNRRNGMSFRFVFCLDGCFVVFLGFYYQASCVLKRLNGVMPVDIVGFEFKTMFLLMLLICLVIHHLYLISYPSC